MLSSHYIEDVFTTFYELVIIDMILLTAQDQTAAASFYTTLLQQKELTQSQANFILKLLDKYKLLSLKSGYDYQEHLKIPAWRTSFRVLDLTKKISVETDIKNNVWVCLKFPYQLKKLFDDEFEDKSIPGGIFEWQHDHKIRRASIYKVNLIHLYEFVQKNNFEIDNSFLEALSEFEEIWQNQDNVMPYSTIVNNSVSLANSSNDTTEWFRLHCSNNVEHDLFLAKSMGYIYINKPTSIVEKIAGSSSNSFWITDNEKLFSLYKITAGKMCIILDRTGNTLEWLTKFVHDADVIGIPRSDIKVCFRETKESNSGINDWIKDNEVGGKVDDGQILIFEYKPAKWLFKDSNDVKMLVTNNLYPPTNQITRDWFSSHPCVIYLGDIKPSEQKGQQIVDL
jgi:hypothetical protein